MQPTILLILQNLTDGGVQRVVPLWAKILVDAGYQVTVLTFYPTNNEYHLDPRVIRANLVPNYGIYAQYKHKKVSCKKLLTQYLTEHPQDLIIPFLISPSLITVMSDSTNFKVLTRTMRNSPWDKEQGLDLFLRDWAIQKQGSVILQNAEQMAYFDTPQFKHVKKYIVHNPINPEIENIKKDHYEAIKKIVAAGRLVPQKNHALMIETIRILRDEFHENYQLDIYGVGELQASLQAQIDAAHLQNQVKLCGRNENIFPVLINYDLFLMTSLFEGTPNALLEAMGLGLPALAVKCRTGITELINNGKNGYYINSFDARALAQKIRAINQPTELARVGKQARQDMFTRYAPQKIQQELVGAVQDLIQNPPPITDIPIETALNLCTLQTPADYQNYFAASLRIIKIADETTAKNIFGHAYRTLQKIAFKTDVTGVTKKKYHHCLRRNQFAKFYQYLQKKIYRH